MKLKHIFLAAILLSPAMYSVAQDAEVSSDLETKASIGERYIRDYIYVPLRSGTSNQHRIVHKGLRSGAIVSLLEEDSEKSYSLVRTTKGVEGWIPSQYLIDEPTAAIKLAEANRTIQQLTKDAGPLSEKLVSAEKEVQNLTRELKKLEREHNALEKELERIKGLSSDAITLDENNKGLLKELELIKNKTDTLAAENSRLQSELTNNDFWYGVLAVIIGVIATMTIQSLTRSRRRSEWA